MEDQIAALMAELKINKDLQEKLMSAPNSQSVKQILEETGLSISDVDIERIESTLVEAELEAFAGGVCWSWTTSADCIPENTTQLSPAP